MKKIYTFIALFCIVALASFLRFWQLGSVPISPDWDEASIGYNAYSLLKTGRDEYGSFLPLTFRSFNDYKPPLYIYLTVPSVAVFGLNVPAVRLPSAVFGVLAVIGVYLLASELIKRGRDKTNGSVFGIPGKIGETIPLLVALFLAISPWHIQFSRVAFEANVGVTLNIWAAFFFLRGLQKKSLLTVSALLFVLSLYAYHSERIFVPTLVLFLGFLYRKELFAEKKPIVIAIIAGILLSLPLVPVILNKDVMARLSGTSVFRTQTELLATDIQKLTYDNAHHDLLGQIFDNRRVEYAKTIVSGYLVHFSPEWLFITGDYERHHAPGMGLLYFWELPFILIGMYKLLRAKSPEGYLFIGWMLLAPIAASPTTDLPHAVRTMVFLPCFEVFSAIGLVASVSHLTLHARRWKASFIAVIVIIIAVMFGYWAHMYFSFTDIEYSEYWIYGYKEAVAYAQAHSSEYKKIVVSTDLQQPYIFFLFYTKYDPKVYLAEGGTVMAQGLYNHFKTFEFRKIDWQHEVKDGKTLYIGTPKEIAQANKAVISYLDGTPAFEIADR